LNCENLENFHECRGLSGCGIGQSKITKGYRLPAKHVIHTVGPVWKGGSTGEPELLASCYRTCFELAKTHSIETIAFPAISCGVYGYPIAAAARIAVRETKSALRAIPEINRVFLVCFTDEVLAAYKSVLETNAG
jgi:O-acetyl-ADP-ribose deacetylase (regulator of RNase III)